MIVENLLFSEVGDKDHMYSDQLPERERERERGGWMGGGKY